MNYEIVGGAYPAVVCHLQAGEKMQNESGSMTWMDPCMEMATTGGGSVGKMFGRMLSAETVFMNVYTAREDGMIAFGSSFPGSIKALDISPDHEVVVQKRSFLASEMGVDLSVFFNHKAKTGIFGGEGFIMQRLSGEGTAFIEIDGGFIEYQLAAGQQMVVDSGNVLGFVGGVTMDVQRIHGAKNIVFGGEGLFNTVLTGPGTIWLQTMPLVNLAEAIAPYVQSGGNS